MNDLYEYYWQRYYRLLQNFNIPDHLVEAAYKTFDTLHRKKDKLYLVSIGYKSAAKKSKRNY